MKNMIEKIGLDKIAHFLGGFTAATILYLAVRDWLCAMVTVALFATMKELIDDKFCWVDLGAGIAGAALAVIVLSIFIGG